MGEDIRVFNEHSLYEWHKLKSIYIPKNVEEIINGKGRVLLRQSGTEPVVRVMIECEDKDQCTSFAQQIVDKILEGGHGIE